MHFYPIDLKTWPRGQMFCYFSRMAPTGYSITVDLDVTRLLSLTCHHAATDGYHVDVFLKQLQQEMDQFRG